MRRLHLTVSAGFSRLAFACLAIFDNKIIPGGPFISFRGDILPHMLTIGVFFACVHYRSSFTRRRVLAILAAGLAVVASEAQGDQPDAKLYTFYRSNGVPGVKKKYPLDVTWAISQQPFKIDAFPFVGTSGGFIKRRRR